MTPNGLPTRYWRGWPIPGPIRLTPGIRSLGRAGPPTQPGCIARSAKRFTLRDYTAAVMALTAVMTDFPEQRERGEKQPGRAEHGKQHRYLQFGDACRWCAIRPAHDEHGVGARRHLGRDFIEMSLHGLGCSGAGRGPRRFFLPRQRQAVGQGRFVSRTYRRFLVRRGRPHAPFISIWGQASCFRHVLTIGRRIARFVRGIGWIIEMRIVRSRTGKDARRSD